MITPFSADHLLTLSHFNLLRGTTALIILVGCDPENMGDDIISPFVDLPGFPSRLPADLPPTLHPTALQKSMPHHPEIDVLPFPKVRDNMLLGAGTYDDYELCRDIFGLHPTSTSILEEVNINEHSFGTGLLLWGDPTMPSSWEVSEAFARKWSWILAGCDEAFQSTNYWRSLRGEAPLVIEELE
jgi:hypothetical protein